MNCEIKNIKVIMDGAKVYGQHGNKTNLLFHLSPAENGDAVAELTEIVSIGVVLNFYESIYSGRL